MDKIIESVNHMNRFHDTLTPFANTNLEALVVAQESINRLTSNLYNPLMLSAIESLKGASLAVDSIRSSIDFARINETTLDTFLALNTFSELANRIYSDNFAPIIDSLRNTIDSATFINFESIQVVLNNYLEADKFSNVEKEQLLNATEFVSYQFVQTAHDLEQSTELLASPYIDKSKQGNHDSDIQLHEFNESENENHSTEIYIQKESSSLVKIIFNRQNFYNEVASIVHSIVIMQVISFLSGNITLENFLEIINYLVELFL